MRIYNQLDKWSLPAADRVVTVCEAFARELAATTGIPFEKIAVQHNSIRQHPRLRKTAVHEFRNRQGLSVDDVVILAVGRLSREKAHRDLLNAFSQLANQHRLEARLLIVGDGPERARLQNQATTLGVMDRVTFTGQQSNIHEYYAIADVLVLPSHSEGSPNVLLEAMAAQVPIVATKVGGVPEIVEDNKTALLVRAGEPTEMAAAIARILREQGLAQRLVANATEVVETRHTPRHYVESLVEVYQETIAARPSTQN